MAGRKTNFSEIAENAVLANISEATADTEVEQAAEVQEVVEKPKKPRKTYTAEEIAEFQENMNTSGRKGAWLKRINTGFSKSNYEYIMTMSRVSGLTLSAFINQALAQHKEDHRDLYEQALEFRKRL
jgi:hypothetical protein